MRVVSDTSPLSCLASLGRLDLIDRQFGGGVMVPHAVEEELLRHPDPRALDGLKAAFSQGAIRVESVENAFAMLGVGKAYYKRNRLGGQVTGIAGDFSHG